MASYEIHVKKSVAKDLRPIPKNDVQQVIKAIRGLVDNPRPPQSRKLTDSEKYHLRCGVYRILYEIQEERLIVCVVKVAHRKHVYRD